MQAESSSGWRNSSRSQGSTGPWAGVLLSLAIAGLFAALIPMAFLRNINWDEFYFLSHIHAWLDGRLDRPMQTFFVHGFGWLTAIPGDEIGQIVAARLVMVAALVLTCFAIWRMGREIAGAEAAKLAVLAFLCSGFVMAHGSSFRADPIATSLLMSALAVMLTSRMGALQIVLVAMLAALALLVTVKAVLYLPAFLSVLIYRRSDHGWLLRTLSAGGLALVIAAGLYLWHSAGLAVAAGNETGANLREAAETTLLSGRVLPRSGEMLLWALLSLPTLVLAVAGFRQPVEARLLILLAGLTLPLLCLVIYRNAFPYFFPFISAPLMLAAAFGAKQLQDAPHRPLLVAAMLVLGFGQTVVALSEGNAAQRATLAEVHRLFGAPVPYIDQHGMVSAFPKQGFFMSTWGLQSYRAAGEPVFAQIIAGTRPPLLLANRHELAQAVIFGDSRPGFLLPEDQATLKDSYIHHVGAIWLAGRELTGRGVNQPFSMPFPGRYRLEAAASVQIDGRTVAPGKVIALDGGSHSLLAPSGQRLRLIWATDGGSVTAPALPASGLYAPFWSL